jgi:serine/threonine-protein kinase
MELVEGEMLADVIGRGAVPLNQALPIARQIAEALAAAHEQGIVHRDLKPANIKVRSDGVVKVLDFGLATAMAPAVTADINVSNSPTLSIAASQAGIILGTAGYMSPEQAAGKPASKASDLWSFGVVLFEMLTGRQAFSGETIAHVLAAVLKSDPDFSALPEDTPPPVRRLLRRCLEKDRKCRLDSANAARMEIEDALASAETVQVQVVAARSRRLVAVVSGAALIAGAISALVTWLLMRPAVPAAGESRFAITPPAGQAPWLGPFDRSIALSPDGRRFVYTTAPAAAPGGTLLVRSMERLEVTPVQGITRARAPFFSTDGQWVGFFEGTNQLMKASLSGGPALSICTFSGAPRGASWGDDGTIVFATSDPTTGLWRVPSAGGEPSILTTPAPDEGDHVFPSVLPGGRGVLYTIVAPGGESDIAVLDAKTNQSRIIVRGASQPEYAITGHVIYAVGGGALRAVRFGLETLQVSGDPAPLPESVRMVPTGAANYAVSRAGTLLYLPAASSTQSERSLAWIDRAGREEPIKAPNRAYFIARLSPDGTRVALDIRDQERDIWILSLDRDMPLRKLTSGPASETNPLWTADHNHLIYTSNRSGAPELYLQAADGSGSATRLTEGGRNKFATSLASDGTGVIGHRDGPATFDIVRFALPTPGRGVAAPLQPGDPVKELVTSPFFEHNAELSPDGRFLAYQSNASGQYEILVRPYPDLDAGTWTVSSGGGTRPLWAKNGKELFYRDAAGAMIAVPVDGSKSVLTWGAPEKLFDSADVASAPDRNYDVSLDGKRFLIIKGSPNARPDDIVVVLNWDQELKRLVPTR